MAKKKNKSRKQGLVSKLLNAAVIGISLSHAIKLLLDGRWGAIVSDYSVGFAGNPQTGTQPEGTFSLSRAARAYGPVVAGFGIGYFIRFLRKRFPVR